jgi:hypothetical protein
MGERQQPSKCNTVWVVLGVGGGREDAQRASKKSTSLELGGGSEASMEVSVSTLAGKNDFCVPVHNN